MESRIPSVHQTMDHHFRGSPASLCSSCSVRCTEHSAPPQQPPPSLPMCNCGNPMMSTHTLPQQPFCSFHGSITPHHLHHQRQASGSPRTLNNGYEQQCPGSNTPCTLHHNSIADPHHTMPCTLHNPLGISNHRYTGTIPADTATHHNKDTKSSNRSLSPFAFLRKNNRDSKTSTNTMLDNTSSKSMLVCSRRWLVAIILTLVLITILSIAVGLVVTFTGRSLV